MTDLWAIGLLIGDADYPVAAMLAEVGATGEKTQAKIIVFRSKKVSVCV